MSAHAQNDKSITLIMLPGLDGTGRLFTPLLRELPGWVKPTVISYPVDRELSYSQLASYVRQSISKNSRVVLLAESFSGPVAIALAAGHKEIAGLILCSTFSSSPRPFLVMFFSMLPLFSIMGSRLPDRLIRAALLGLDSTNELIAEFRSAVRSVKPSVLSHRFKEIAGVNVSSLLGKIDVPVCMIRGKSDMLVPDGALHAPEGAELHILEGSHLLLQTRANESARIISRFLEKL